jgi:hypothetical protein
MAASLRYSCAFQEEILDADEQRAGIQDFEPRMHSTQRQNCETSAKTGKSQVRLIWRKERDKRINRLARFYFGSKNLEHAEKDDESGTRKNPRC